MISGQQGNIERLKERLETLPVRRRAAGRVEVLEKYRKIVADASDVMQKVIIERHWVLLVFPNASLEAADKSLMAARTGAQKLLDALKTVDEIDNTGVESQMRVFAQSSKNAGAAVQNEWRQQVEAHASRYARLVDALQKARIPNSNTLRAAIDRVQQMESPPTSEAAALRAAKDVSGLPSAVKDLGVEGRVGEFLTAAAEKRAAAEALRQPEVVAFLDQNDLWDVLVVGFQ